MDTQELKDYLKDVYELESQAYTYRKLIDLYNDKARELSKSRDSVLGAKPSYYREELYEKYGKVNRECSGYLHDILKYLPDDDTRRRLEKKLDSPHSGFSLYGVPALIFIFSLFLIIITRKIFLPIVFGFGLYFFYVFKINPDVTSQSNISGEILSAYEDYYITCLGIKYKEVQPKIDKLNEFKNEHIHKNLKSVETLLKKLYSKNIIHSKYRNFIAVAQIYEYLDTGRCTELEGANGAYNLFESELRQNIIINKLDEIIYRLDQIQNTMYCISSAISNTNILLNSVSKQLGQMSSSLSAIERNTALTAYNTQCTAFNTNLMRRYY